MRKASTATASNIDRQTSCTALPVRTTASDGISQAEAFNAEKRRTATPVMDAQTTKAPEPPGPLLREKQPLTSAKR
jgi:hypothetical protein